MRTRTHARTHARTHTQRAYVHVASTPQVKFLIADFSSLFGAAEGSRLQRWAIRYGWPLLWSIGINQGPMTQSRFWSIGKSERNYATDPYGRLIDPLVASGVGVNVSSDESARTRFAAAWSTASAVRNGSTSFNATAWEDAWRELRDSMPSLLHVSPLWAGACANLEKCFGVSAERAMCACTGY